MTRASRLIYTALLCSTYSFFVGCGGNIHTNFDGDVTKPLPGMPQGSVPTEGDGPFPTQYCYQTNGQFNQGVSTTRGKDSHDWALGGTCAFRSLRETWAAYNNSSLLRWPEAESFSATMRTPPAGVQIFWDTHYHLSRFPVGDVDWDMAWYHTLMEGSPANPRQIVINYAKYNGTSFIDHWQGSILLEFVTPSITSVTVKDTLTATQQDSSNCEKTVRALINKAQSGAPNYDPINGLPNQTQPLPSPTSSPTPPPAPAPSPPPSPIPDPDGGDPTDPDPCDHIPCLRAK